MTDLIIKVFPCDQIPEGVKSQIDIVSREAFQNNPPELMNVQWSSSNFTVVGFIDDAVISVVEVLEREILVGGKPLKTGGIGGVCTKADWRKHGFASAMMKKAHEVMSKTLGVKFGLLITGEDIKKIYAGVGWKVVASEWKQTGLGEPQWMVGVIMAIELGDEQWPDGEIDVCGKPW